MYDPIAKYSIYEYIYLYIYYVHKFYKYKNGEYGRMAICEMGR